MKTLERWNDVILAIIEESIYALRYEVHHSRGNQLSRLTRLLSSAHPTSSEQATSNAVGTKPAMILRVD